MSADLARRENRADIVAGIDLSRQPPGVGSILRDLALRETRRRSRRVARLIVTELRGVTRLAPRPVRSARFMVLRAPDVPSVLIELGFLTNARDSRRMVNDAHMRRVARGIAVAVNRYFGHKPAAAIVRQR
jgi:N-acetylmuramoyl-L-alanine amidase